MNLSGNYQCIHCGAIYKRTTGEPCTCSACKATGHAGRNQADCQVCCTRTNQQYAALPEREPEYVGEGS